MPISVIMPVYNAQDSLKRAVISVLAQSYTWFELILVDDGSTDDSAKIASSFDDPRVKYFHIENHGASYARNFGLAMACYNRCCFIDSDDEYDKNYLKNMAYHDDDLVMCNIKIGGKRSDPLGPKDEMLLEAKTLPHKMDTLIRSGMLNSPVNKLYKTDIIRKHNISFDTSMVIGEDFQFNFHYVQHCKEIRYIPDVLYIYHRDDSKGVHASYLPNVIEQRRINIDMIEQYFKEHNVRSSLVNQLKVKLIYIYVIQELNQKTPKKEILEGISIPYFKEISKVNGKAFKWMLKVYQKGNIYRICALANVMRIARKFLHIASV